MTQQRLWLGFALLAGASFAIQVALPADLDGSPETSWDTAPRGHAALFELLVRFDATPGRWLTGLTMPAADQTIWYVAPHDTCEGTVSEESPGDPAPVAFRYLTLPWIEAGGTAVVWLSHPPLPSSDEDDPGKVDDDTEESGEYETIAHPGPAPSSRSDLVAKAGDDESPGEREAGEAEDEEAIREGWREDLQAARAGLREGRTEVCEAIAGIPLPPRRLAGLEGGELPREGRYAPVVFSIGRAVDRREDFDYDATRVLPGSTLAFFEDEGTSTSEGWRPLWVEANDFTPIALERKIGLGRLVVVADARVLTNGRLGNVDSAPFVFDWVADYGPPWLDEHAHGAVPESGTFRYLAGSPARAALFGLLVLGGLVLWRGHAWPVRRVAEADPEAPTLTTFVDSLARLYAGTRDHDRVFERYRALGLERIRRALGLAPGTSAEVVVASLRAREVGWSALRETGLGDLLTRNVSISDAGELARAAGRLDRLVEVVRAGREAERSRATAEVGEPKTRPARGAGARGRS